MAEIFVYAFYVYLVIGLLFGLWFVSKGVHKIDAGMKEVKWILRLMILPGAMALWPIILRKYIKSQ